MHPLGKKNKIKTVFKDSLVSIKSHFFMPKRTSINDVKHLDELNDLDKIVLDKRNALTWMNFFVSFTWDGNILNRDSSVYP